MDGIYLVDKPKDITSFDCIRLFKEKFKVRKVGHAGTLDPFATGLLVIMLGQSTKLSDHLLNDDKTYEGTITFGRSTNTYDHTGETVEEKTGFRLKRADLERVFSEFIGNLKQTPPIYSAVKVEGKKLYEYARPNKKVNIPSRKVIVHSLEIIKISGKNVSFKATVSKGTYIRSLANDIGKALDIPAHLSKLRRTKSGEFNIEDAYKLSEINRAKKPTISLLEYADSIKKVFIKPYLIPHVLNGVLLDKRQTSLKEIFSVFDENNNFMAFYKPHYNKYKPFLIYKDYKHEDN